MYLALFLLVLRDEIEVLLAAVLLALIGGRQVRSVRGEYILGRTLSQKNGCKHKNLILYYIL
jgi:hypothetical protein